jgi:hypothetical protein
MNLKKSAVTAATVLGVVAGGAATAGVASAAPAPAPHQLVAVTHLPDRGDSGDTGNTWAKGNLTRTETFQQTGASVPGMTYQYKVTVKDVGSFLSNTNETSPAGTHHIGPKAIPGKVVGEASYTITANKPVNAFKPNLGVPGYENDHGAYISSGPTSTSDWFETAFPAGTTFGGAGIGNWKWTYTANHVLTGTKNVPVVHEVRTGSKWELVTVWKNGHKTVKWEKVPTYKKVVTIKKVNQYQNEKWIDANVNSGGDIYGV